MNYVELAASLRYYATHVPNLSASFYAHLWQAADAINELANWWSMAKTLSDMVMPSVRHERVGGHNSAGAI